MNMSSGICINAPYIIIKKIFLNKTYSIMFKYSITKKQVYALVLESKKITYKPRQKKLFSKKDNI